MNTHTHTFTHTHTHTHTHTQDRKSVVERKSVDLGGRRIINKKNKTRHEHRRHTHVIFFFQAEDGIRDSSVTGVQTCALPISHTHTHSHTHTLTHTHTH